MLYRLMYFIRFSHTDLVEMTASLAAVLWGAWVACPFFLAFDDSSVYKLIMFVMPENFWGLLVMLVGLLQLWGLVADRHNLRKRSAMAAMGIWIFLTIQCFQSDPRTPITAFFLLFALASMLVYLRIGRYYVIRH